MHVGEFGGDGLAERVTAGGEDPFDELGVFFRADFRQTRAKPISVGKSSVS